MPVIRDERQHQVSTNFDICYKPGSKNTDADSMSRHPYYKGLSNKLNLKIKRWKIFSINFFLASPEPLGSQGELIVYPYSGVRCRRCRRRQQCLNIFSSETALPIKAKFYVETPWEGGTKVYIKGPGHLTKMAAMPIYGKNL